MSVINKKAEELQVGLGFIEIIMIAGLIVNLFRLYQDCQKSADDIHNEVRRLSFREKRLLRKEIQKQLGDDKYMEYRDIVEAEVLKMAQNLSKEDIEEMLKEVSQQG